MRRQDRTYLSDQYGEYEQQFKGEHQGNKIMLRDQQIHHILHLQRRHMRFQEQSLMQQNIQQNQPIQPNIQMTDEIKPDTADILRQKKIYQYKNSRLIINKIVLNDFKSYAGTQTIGQFHKQFTSIVGPNGSGKSNLIQSLLFIFGFSASWMRQSKLGQLIHRSQGSSDNQKASVQVEFYKIYDSEQNQNQYTVLQSFTLRRTVNHSNVSKYYIDGSECSQKDVKTKLLNEGIDLTNNRFLILQGEVEQISTMPPTSGDPNKPGLLQYLQDIIGSNTYVDKIAKLVEQYTKLEQKRHEKGELMKMVENQLRGMSKLKTQAIQYVKAESTITKTESILVQIGLQQQNLALKQINNRLDQFQKQKEKVVAQQKQKLQKQKQRIKQIKKNKQKLQNIGQNLANQQRKLNQLQMADKKLKEEVSYKSEDMVKYNRQLNQLDQQMQNTIKQAEQIRVDQQPKLAQKLTSLQKQNDQLKDELAKYNKPEIQNQLRQLQKIKKSKQLQITSFKNKHQNIKQEYEKMFQVMRVNDQKLKVLQNKIVQNSTLLVKIDQAVTSAKNIQTDLNSSYKHFERDQTKIKTEIQQIENTINDLKSQCREKGGADNMFNKIMQENIKGVYGRLGDLAKVSQQYDQIVTSCFGSRLDNIVVQDFQAATTVVEYLKKSKVGRASCIILDKIKEFSYYMNKKQPLPDKAIRVFDMIQPKIAQVSVAFYFVVQQTIYVRDSDLGLQYSMQDDRNPKRVISQTKNGFIIYQTNGLMNGCPRKRGGFQTKANHQNLIKAQNQVKELENSKEQLLKKLKELMAKKQSAKTQIQSVNSDLSQLIKQKNLIEQNIRNFKDQVADLKRSNYIRPDWSYQDKIDHQKKRVEKEISAIQSKIKSLQVDMKELEQVIYEKQQQRKAMQSQSINEKRQKFKQIKEQLQNVTKKIDHNIAILQNGMKKVQENRAKKAKLEKKLLTLRLDLNHIAKQQKSIEQVALQKYALVTKYEAQKMECQSLDRQMRVLLEDQNKQVAISKQNIQIARAKLQKCRQQKQSKEKDIKQIGDQLKRIRQSYTLSRNQHPYLQDCEQVQKMYLKGQNKKAKQKQEQQKQRNPLKKQVPIQRIKSINPVQDLTKQKIQQFVLLQEPLMKILQTSRQKLSQFTTVNVTIIKQYKQKYLDYVQKVEQFQNTSKIQQQVREKANKLKKQRLEMFTLGFNQINAKLREVYQTLTKGGDATLDLIDSLDPFSDGIKFSVRPPKKAWKQINKLSGGQKTLSSLSLIFALHYFRPTPIYFMDEIDAALDYRNVSIVAEYIKKRTRNAQFIIISLRNNMFELSDKLIGIYKNEDQTKVLQLDLGDSDIDEDQIDEEFMEKDSDA